MTQLFDEACEARTCPKCCGCVEGPQWEYTLQGKVYTVHCLICGWRDNSDEYVIDYSVSPKELPGHITKMKRATRQVEIIKVPRRLPLSQYEWGEEK